MGEEVALPEQVSAQEYMMNLLVDGDDDEDVRLHLAALCGDSTGILQLLTDPNIKNWLDFRVRPYMSPPLRLAVSGGSCECIEILLDAGASIDLEDVKGQTPLFVATSGKKLEIMEVLLKRGAHPDGSKKNRCSPLIIAVRDGFANGVKLLLQYGADPEPFEQFMTCVPGWPLQHSIVYSHFTCFLELLRGGCMPNLTALPFTLKDNLISRLSIPHAILKYSSEFPEFVRLYHECGGNLCQANPMGVLITDEGFGSSPARDILFAVSGSPLHLKSICRLRIRELLGRKRLCRISSLDIPSSLIPFLNYEEFDIYSVRTKENTHTKLPVKNEE